MHSSICESYLVSSGSVALGLISGGVHLPWVCVTLSIAHSVLV